MPASSDVGQVNSAHNLKYENNFSSCLFHSSSPGLISSGSNTGGLCHILCYGQLSNVSSMGIGNYNMWNLLVASILSKLKFIVITLNQQEVYDLIVANLRLINLRWKLQIIS